MKKICSAVLAALIALTAMSGCAGEPEPTENTTLPTETKPVVQQTVPPTETQATEPTEETVTRPVEPTETEPTAAPETEPTQPPETTKPKHEYVGDIYTRAQLEKMDTTVNGYGQGVNVDEKNRPIGALNAQATGGEYDAYFIAPENGNIYLTFDEGYENGYTSKILDVLKKKQVKAVFFVTLDYCKRNPELIRRMVEEGHAVGNHSVHHKSMPTLSIDDMIDEVMDLHNYVKDNFGYTMHLFRPPMGEYSEQSLAVLQNLGYKTVNWSFAYYDYDPEDQPTLQKAYKRVVGAAHEGAIYLLHAISQTNTEILGDVIDEFRAQGYKLELFS